MITDWSGLSKVGLALLRANRDKLIPPKRIELKIRGDQQVLVVTGPLETFEESVSFGWGRADERTKALSEGLEELGWPLPLETLQQIPAGEERLPLERALSPIPTSRRRD